MNGSKASGICLEKSQTNEITIGGQKGLERSGAVIQHTEILDVLVRQKRKRSLLAIARPKASLVCLVDDNPISGNCREEGKTIGGLRPTRIVVDGNVGKAISCDG